MQAELIREPEPSAEPRVALSAISKDMQPESKADVKERIRQAI